MLRQVRALILVLPGLLLAAGCQKSQPASAPAASGSGSAAAPAPSSRATVSPEGDAASGEAFALRLEAPDPLSAGATGQLRLHLEAKPPYHLNAEYPHAFRPAAESTGVTFESARVELTANAERAACEAEPKDTCALSTQIPFKADAAGAHKLAGVVAFSVCTAEVCLIEKIPLASAVTVR